MIFEGKAAVEMNKLGATTSIKASEASLLARQFNFSLIVS